MPLHVSSTVVLIVRRSTFYNTKSGIVTPKQSEWSKITKIQFYKYEHRLVNRHSNFLKSLTTG